MTVEQAVPRGLPLKERRRLSRLIAESDAPYVVLIGSWARGTQVEGVSDLDVLIGASGGASCGDWERMHVICIPPEELVKRAAEGDDVALWCTRYGVPLSGRARWARLTSQILAANPQPGFDKKFRLARRQFAYAQDLLNMGDLHAAQEELRVGLGHLARGLLIQAGVFPLSRPELKSQLSSADYAGLGDLLTSVNTAILPEKELRRALANARDSLPEESSP